MVFRGPDGIVGIVRQDRGGMTDTIGLEDFQALANQSIISDAYETERLQKERISKGREKEKVQYTEDGHADLVN